MDDLERLLGLAAGCEERGDLKSAEKHWLRAVETLQKSAEGSWELAHAQHNLGRTRLALGDPVGGLEASLRALETRERVAPADPGCASSCNNIGLCYLELS